MDYIYYFFGFLFLMYEMYFLTSLKRHYKEAKEWHEFYQANRDIKWDGMTKDQQNYAVRKLIVGIPMLFWTLTGLLTFQWFTFLAFLIVDFFFLGLVKKMVGYTKARIVVIGISTLLGIVTIAFIIINKFHLHIDTYSWFVENILK